MSTIQEVREKAEASIARCVARRSVFGWPLDGVACEPWGYDLHVSWVRAWNATGREKPAVEHLRAWLAEDANVQRALDEAAARALPPEARP